MSAAILIKYPIDEKLLLFRCQSLLLLISYRVWELTRETTAQLAEIALLRLRETFAAPTLPEEQE